MTYFWSNFLLLFTYSHIHVHIVNIRETYAVDAGDFFFSKKIEKKKNRKNR